MPISEKAFQAQVLQLAKLCGWLTYHTHDSRRSAKGFPDLVAVRGCEVFVAELKTDTGKVTPEQEEWIRAFTNAGVRALVLRPADWPFIERLLSSGVTEPGV